ncbi:DUF2441 domain-containing protein [Flavobacterium collinsii]|uniref:DUF2441 domain-containing protein n=1 Tax=Flavobacterium collinsii TaxID=1114861 RepID=A0A9W4TH99_9FLAO|nr:DUF2441 domain-containing protein [Flavobacterium collinsii]CAI2768165.1 conserved protein of unknown function [Flavobacterium collinsii]
MNVDKKIFYHIHKKVKNDTWAVGTTLSFDKTKYNFFTENLKEISSEIFKGDFRKDFSIIRDLVEKSNELINIIDKQPDLALQNQLLRDNVTVSLQVNTKLANYLGYYIKHLNEMIFEEIRAEHFSSLPSRMHGIWLCNEDEIGKWQNILGSDCETEIYRVSATGFVHHANASLIRTDSLPISEIEELARMYWSEVPFDKDYCKESEILFEGELEILGLHR